MTGKQYDNQSAQFQDRIRDFRAGEEYETELAMTIGFLLGAKMPGLAAAVAVAYETLYPEGARELIYLPPKDKA